MHARSPESAVTPDATSAAPDVQSQWNRWAVSRRSLLKTSLAGVAAAAIANGGMLPIRSVAAQDDATPVAGGSLYMSLADDDVQSFDPIVPTDNMSIWTMLLIYDQLIRVAPDGVSLEPGLAEKWEISDDFLTYTFHLRDATWHDGSAVTADDAVFSIQRAATDPASTWGSMISVLKSAEAKDAKTLVITLSSVWAPFEADLALFACSIIPKAAYEAQKDKLFDKPIGSGPFVFDSWNKGSEIVLKKNATYWEAGKPYLDELHFMVLTDANARMLQFQGGDLDIVTAVPYSQIESLKSNPDVVVLQDAVARTDYVMINNSREPWDDKNLRQAINYAIDKDTLLANVLFNNGKMANTFLPLMAGHTDDVVGYPFNLDKAKELVAQSKGKDGFKGELLIASGDTVGDQISQIIASQLKEIGGEITVTSMEGAARREKVRVKGDYDFSIGYYTTDIIDPDELTVFVVVSAPGGIAGFSKYKNEEIDKLATQAAQEHDWPTREKLYAQIQQIHSDDAPMIFLFYPTGGVATSSAVQNFKVLPTGNYRLWDTWKKA
ncbi:MAG TPA: ABC transporter substrate-binding protein [Thermomicrobiales bacterium]|nr:ABC transporter substrate-binding protein [Thermomicrobiales bacterium]